MRQVLKEINAVFDENHRDAYVFIIGGYWCSREENRFMNSLHLSIRSVACSTTGDRSLVPLLQYRHESLQRNKRCLLAYLHHRLQRIRHMRWQFGATLPDDIKATLCAPELQWFNAYSQSLAAYMRSIGDGAGIVNLTEDLKPPKSLYVEVRCIVDYGKYELDDGEVILLKRNSQHYLPRSECEPLIRQGILQHIA